MIFKFFEHRKTLISSFPLVNKVQDLIDHEMDSSISLSIEVSMIFAQRFDRNMRIFSQMRELV